MSQNLTIAALNAAYVKLSAAFDYSYEQFQKSVENWAASMVMDGGETPNNSITFERINDVVGLRKGKKGQRPLHRTLTGESFTINLEKWDDGLEVSHHDIVGDTLGIVMARAQQTGQGAALLNHDQIIDTLTRGDVAGAFLMADGLPLFDNAHIKGADGGTFDNLQTGAFSKTTLAAMRTLQLRFPSDAGAARPLNVKATDVVGPPDIFMTVLETVRNATIGQGSTATNAVENVLASYLGLQPHEDSMLVDTDNWYLIANAGFVKPFVNIRKTGFSPFKLNCDGLITDSEAYRDEVLRFWGSTYEITYPSDPIFFIKVVN